MRLGMANRPVRKKTGSAAKDGASITVRALSSARTTGQLSIGRNVVPCALGRSGCGFRKREGDGITPIGVWPIRQVFYRADRVARPSTVRPVRRLKHDDGWCDGPADANYNRHVVHPYLASAERMWRADQLYDVVFVLGHNDRPRVRGGGSAIFMHFAADGLLPTEGCVAISRQNFLRLGRLIARADKVRIVGGRV